MPRIVPLVTRIASILPASGCGGGQAEVTPNIGVTAEANVEQEVAAQSTPAPENLSAPSADASKVVPSFKMITPAPWAFCVSDAQSRDFATIL